MGERMEEVEVVCPSPLAGNGYIRRLPVAPNSLTAARLRLADAAEAFNGATTTEWFDRYTALRVEALEVAALRTKRAGG